MNLRLLYDLSTHPFSIGDLLCFQETSLILREQHKADKIDVVVTYNPKNAVLPSPSLSYIKDNFQNALKWLMPVARVNQHLGSASLKTHGELEPHPLSYPELGSPYLYYTHDELMAKHYQKTGSIPELKPLPETEEWAHAYLETHGRVTVHVRRNEKNPARNSDYGVWADFMSEHSDDRFVIVCSPGEVDNKLRLPNTHFACDDVGTDTEKICALVQASDVHLGVSSGPINMRIFGKKPFIAFRDGTKPSARSFTKSGDVLRHLWAVEGQTLTTNVETVDRLNYEFGEMCELV